MHLLGACLGSSIGTVRGPVMPCCGLFNSNGSVSLLRSDRVRLWDQLIPPNFPEAIATACEGVNVNHWRLQVVVAVGVMPVFWVRDSVTQRGWKRRVITVIQHNFVCLQGTADIGYPLTPFRMFIQSQHCVGGQFPRLPLVTLWVERIIPSFMN